MATNFLPLCVGVTLTMVGGGICLLHLALQLQRYGESRRDFMESLRFEKHARNFEGIAIALLFASWMPCSNAAWITQASCTLAIQQMAATVEKPKSETIVGVAHGIALESSAGSVAVAYESKFPSGTTVAWSRVGDSRSATVITANATHADSTGSALGLRLRNGTGGPDIGSGRRGNNRTSDGGGGFTDVPRWTASGANISGGIDEAAAKEF